MAGNSIPELAQHHVIARIFFTIKGTVREFKKKYPDYTEMQLLEYLQEYWKQHPPPESGRTWTVHEVSLKRPDDPGFYYCLATTRNYEMGWAEFLLFHTEVGIINILHIKPEEGICNWEFYSSQKFNEYRRFLPVWIHALAEKWNVHTINVKKVKHLIELSRLKNFFSNRNLTVIED